MPSADYDEPWNAHIQQIEIGEKGWIRVLGGSPVIGLTISVVQAVTQINETSLRLVPGTLRIFR